MCPSSVPATATALGSDVSHLTSEVVRLASAEDTGHGDDSSDPRRSPRDGHRGCGVGRPTAHSLPRPLYPGREEGPPGGAVPRPTCTFQPWNEDVPFRPLSSSISSLPNLRFPEQNGFPPFLR